MFSRLAVRSAKVWPTTVQGSHIRAASTESAKSVEEQIAAVTAKLAGPPKIEGPTEFDKRLEHTPPVRHGFIPDSWFTFFYPKTGVTGPYVFLTGVSTYLVSKEIYVLEHEFYNGLTFLAMWIFAVKKFGGPVKEFLCKDRDQKIKPFYDEKLERIEKLENEIKLIDYQQGAVETQKWIMEAKKINVQMQLEAIYRERLAEIYNAVKKRLDYQTQLDAIERRIAQKHMAQWVVNSVQKAITPEQEKATLQQCIKDLQVLAKA